MRRWHETMLEGSFAGVNLVCLLSWWSHQVPARCPHLKKGKWYLVLHYTKYCQQVKGSDVSLWTSRNIWSQWEWPRTGRGCSEGWWWSLHPWINSKAIWTKSWENSSRRTPMSLGVWPDGPFQNQLFPSSLLPVLCFGTFSKHYHSLGPEHGPEALDCLVCF